MANFAVNPKRRVGIRDKVGLDESGLDSPCLLSALIDVVCKGIPKRAFDEAIRSTRLFSFVAVKHKTSYRLSLLSNYVISS